MGAGLGGEREERGLNYDEVSDDYADDDSHEIEDNTLSLTAIGVGILGAGCFIGIPSCLGVPFLF